MRRGSALIIAMLIMTAIGSVAFGVGRVLLFEIGTASIYENGIQAFYAAESGIEEGFLRYRYDMDAELPLNSALSPDIVERSNLNDLSVVGTWVDTNSAVTDPLKQFFDLKVNPKASAYGSASLLNTTDTKSPYYIPRDESKKFRVNMDDNVNLVMKSVGSAVSGPKPLDNAQKRCVLIEIKVIGKVLNTSTTTTERKALFRSDESALCGDTASVITTGAKLYNMDGSNVITLNNLKAVAWPDLGPLAYAELYIKPIGNDLTVSFTSGNGQPVYNAYSKVESTGYYNGTSRKISANIDRQHGTLYDLFDYVVYKGQ